MGQGDDCKGQGAITLIANFLVFYPTGLKNGYASRKTIFNPATSEDREMKSQVFSTLRKSPRESLAQTDLLHCRRKK